MTDDLHVPGQLDLLDEVPARLPRPPRPGDRYRVQCQTVSADPWEGTVTIVDVVELNADGGRRWRLRYVRPSATPADEFEHVAVVVGQDGHALDGTAWPA